MVSPQKRRMQYDKKKTPNGTKRVYFKGKHKKIRCAITGKVLSGVPHEKKVGLKKHSKTQKRPSAPFGGVLSGEGRHEVMIELSKVKAGIKEMADVDIKYRKYVEQSKKLAEVE